MKKLKLLLLALVATISLGAWAETDVTNLLNDAAIASEANWGGGSSSGGNHSRNAAGYWESWHNTFTLTQTINGLDAGYYMVSIQGVVEGGSTTAAVLTATSGSNTASAYLRNNTRGNFDENAAALKASPNLHRSYATVKVEDGKLTVSFKQTATDQWIVYGQFKLHKLTEEEGANQQTLETALSGKSWGVNGSTGPYHGLNEKYFAGGGEAGYVMSSSFSEMPKGIYEVSVTAAASYTPGRGIEGKTGDNLTVFRVNEVDVNVPVVDRSAVDYSAYTTYTVKSSVGDDGKLTFGLYNLEAKGGNWFIYGINNITYYGDLASALATARSKAKAIIDAEPKMNLDIWNNLKTEYTNSEDVSEDKMSDAIESLNTAIDNANASIAEYAKMKVIYDKLNTQLTDEGLLEFADYKTKYDNNELTNYDDFREAYIALLKQYPRINADVTEAYIQNGNLLEGAAGWTCNPNPAADACENDGKIGVIEFYAGWSSCDMKEYSMIQNITLPSGQYRLSSNAFYRYGGAWDTDKSKSEANMLCGTNYTLLPTLGSVNPGNYPNSRGDAIAAFESGYYGTSTDFKILEDGTKINVGYTGTHSSAKSWFISGPLKLTYLGSVSIEGYINDLKTALANVPEGKMNGTVEDNLENAVKSAEELIASYENDPTSVNAKEADSAGEALRSAIIAANSSITLYANIKTALDLYNEKANNLDTAGKESYNTNISEISSGYENGTLTEDKSEDIYHIYLDAIRAQNSPNADFTGLITNATITSTTGWNNSRVNSGQQYTGAPDNTYFDVYNETRNMTQNIGKLKLGLYTLKCATRASDGITSGNIYVSQNGSNLSSTDIHKDGSEGGSLGNGWSWTEVTFQVTDETKDITIGFYAECGDYHWAGADNFTLTFVGKAFTLNVSDAGYATMYLDYPVAIPTGASVFYVKDNGVNQTSVTKVAIEGVIPANTGVVVNAANDAYTFVASNETPATVEGNLLKGSVTETVFTGLENAYLLTMVDDKPVFGKASAGTLAPNKAWLELSSSAAKIEIDDNSVTDINSINATFNENSTYNLQGVRVNKNFKGIVVSNGKKYINK